MRTRGHPPRRARTRQRGREPRKKKRPTAEQNHEKHAGGGTGGGQEPPPEKRNPTLTDPDGVRGSPSPPQPDAKISYSN